MHIFRPERGWKDGRTDKQKDRMPNTMSSRFSLLFFEKAGDKLTISNI